MKKTVAERKSLILLNHDGATSYMVYTALQVNLKSLNWSRYLQRQLSFPRIQDDFHCQKQGAAE